MPVDSADDRLLDVLHQVRPRLDEVVAVGVRERLVLHLFDIRTGRKRFVAARDDDGANGGFLVELGECIVDVDEDGGGEGVEGLGAVESDCKKSI